MANSVPLSYFLTSLYIFLSVLVTARAFGSYFPQNCLIIQQQLGILCISLVHGVCPALPVVVEKSEIIFTTATGHFNQTH